MKPHLFAATAFSFMCITACTPSVTANPAMRFIDVPQGVVWGDAIEFVNAEGYMTGKGSNRFDPDTLLTRAEAAVVMLKAKHGTDYLPVETEGEWWVSWVSAAVNEGLIDEEMDPDSPATRADIATLVWLLEQ